MNFFKDIYKTYQKNNFTIFTFLLIANLLSYFQKDRILMIIGLAQSFIPNSISTYLKQVVINSEQIFSVYAIILCFEFILFIYIALSNKFYFTYETKAIKTFEKCVIHCIVLSLIGNCLSTLNILEIGIIDYFEILLENPIDSFSLICYSMQGFNLTIGLLIIFGYFVNTQIHWE